jgi:hypothetical protein
VGEWREGAKHGLGSYYYDDDYVFEGKWAADKKVEGTVTYCRERFRQVFFPEEGDHFTQKPAEETVL